MQRRLTTLAHELSEMDKKTIVEKYRGKSFFMVINNIYVTSECITNTAANNHTLTTEVYSGPPK